MSHAAREWALRQDLKPIPKFVLVVLGDTANDEGICWPRVSVIAEKVGVSARTVQRAVQFLIQSGLILVEPRFRSDGSHSSNRYRLLLDAGVSVSPPPDTSDAPSRHARQGAPDTAVIPGTVRGTEREPPPPSAESGCAGCGGRSLSEFHFPKDLLPAEQAEASAMIAGLDVTLAQRVLDEWTGIIAAGAIRSSRLGCLRGLIKRARAGTFVPERAPRVAQARAARQRAEAAHAKAITEPPELPPADADHPLVRRMQAIAQRRSGK